MTTKRKSISKKTRFEVFKRDSFTCQYCGESAPDVVLEVDHIDPVSKGGSNDMMNFITSCKCCNSGKSNRKISDDSAVKKQKAQLDELNERREQLEMMISWRDAIKDINSSAIDSIKERWSDVSGGFYPNDTGVKTIKSMLKKYGLVEFLKAMDEAADSYIFHQEDGTVTKESAETAFSKIGSFLRLNRMPEDQRRLYYIKGILNRRLAYVPFDIINQLINLLETGISVEKIEYEAKRRGSWNDFDRWMTNVFTESGG